MAEELDEGVVKLSTVSDAELEYLATGKLPTGNGTDDPK
jgi:hypothetical protein